MVVITVVMRDKFVVVMMVTVMIEAMIMVVVMTYSDGVLVVVLMMVGMTGSRGVVVGGRGGVDCHVPRVTHSSPHRPWIHRAAQHPGATPGRARFDVGAGRWLWRRLGLVQAQH